MTLGERIKKVRKSLDLTQREFSERVAMKQNSVAQIEGGRNTSDQTIRTICHEFNISEEWLRTGEGEMFVPKETDALDELVKQRKLSGSDRLLIEKFLGLKPEERAAVMNYVLSIATSYRALQKEETTAAEIKAQKEQMEAAAEISVQKQTPTPVPGSGLESDKKLLTDSLIQMNPDLQQRYFDQMRKLKESQTEALPLSAPAEADKKTPGSELLDQS